MKGQFETAEMIDVVEVQYRVIETRRQKYADPTVRREVLAYYRALFSPRELTSTWRLLAAPPAVPTLVLYGDADGCFPTTAFPTALAAERRRTTTPLSLTTVPGVGHFPQLEAPAAVHLA